MSLRQEFDPAVFHDAVASKTPWTAVVSGGWRFPTHVLVKVGSSRLVLERSLELLVRGLGLVVVGSFASTFAALDGSWAVAPIGLLFAGAGLFLLWPRPVVFDGGNRVFTARGRSTPFAHIHAVQLIEKFVKGAKTPAGVQRRDHSYFSYELNLVLTDGERINVLGHENLAQLRSDARTLGTFLGCPFWDATA